jgi:drug/metabolite transporter (DMT)-like permease
MTGIPKPSSAADNLKGAFWMFLAVVLFTATVTFVKLLGKDLDTSQIVFIRSIVGFLFVLPFALKGGRTVFFPKRPWVLLIRMISGNGNLFCSFYAVAHLQLATAVAISFVRPLLLVFLAIWFLGEVIRWRRWTATIVGFLGVLVMIRPGLIEIEFAVIVALIGAAFGAASHTSVKLLTGSERHLTLLIYPSLFGIIIFMGPGLYYWQVPTVSQIGLLIVMGVSMILAQTCVVKAFAAGEATFISPIQFIRLIGAALIGYLIFSEVPDTWDLVGAMVIVASTLYMAHREFKLRNERATLPVTTNTDD